MSPARKVLADADTGVGFGTHLYRRNDSPHGRCEEKWIGRFLVDPGATDTFAPASALRRLGIKPSGTRSYELADGSHQELPIGFGVIEVMGEPAGGTLVFAGEDEEPLLGVTVLESAGFILDPRQERLLPRTPKRKRRTKGRRM